jgi:hypothetical protein
VGGDGEHERRGGLEQRRRDRDGEGEGQGHRRRPELGDGLVGGWITGSERWGDGESRAAAEQSVSAMACMGRIWLVWALDLGLRFWGSFFLGVLLDIFPSSFLFCVFYEGIEE